MTRGSAPRPPALGRRGPVRLPKIALLVFSEGGNTEPKYLDFFARAHGNSLVRLHVVAPAGVPKTIVESAYQAKLRMARSKDRLAQYDQVWAVFDKDDHDDIDQAINLAQSRGIHVAFSNPCFEVWLLLHRCDYDTDEHRRDTQKRYRALDKTYDLNGSKSADMQTLMAGYPQACNRAIRMRRLRETERNSKGAPYTDVDLLTELIRENGKRP